MMYYKCHRVNSRCGGSKIGSPDWIKKKKATINPKNEDDKCFQYAVTVALNYEYIKWNPKPISNITPFITKCNWEGINYTSKIDDWKTSEKNNTTSVLNILYIKGKEICPAYLSKINSNCEKQIIILMIPRKKRLALSRGKETIYIIKRNNIKTSR